ncbi:MAG: hypothetical protein KF749_07205 [Bacteroidetes bacterium]|nr:hypothetical protein [Bacteroidota bacterium]MCW5896559.1 hypothetical protein [Bacteroidota bacterium]
MAQYRIAGGIAVTLVLALITSTAHTQSPPDSSTFLERAVKLGGEIGTYGEWYSINGQDRRRPSTTGRLFIRPTLTFFDALSLNFDILLSTEGTAARQNINQLGLHPTWKWGNAHVGDFSETYSDYTLNGIMIRGGAFNINPGIFRLSAIGGFTKRAVGGGADNGAFDRYLYGGKIGIGTEAGGYVDLLFLRVRDEISSLPASSQTVAIDSSNPSLTPPRRFEVTPQENLVAGILANLKLFENTIQWKTDATVGLFTRDMRVTADTTLKIPSPINKLYRANVTSNIDVAVTSEMIVDVGNVNVKGGYKYIGSGYNSLGTAYLLNDQQEFLIAPSFRIADWSVAVSYTRQNDNLLNQKTFTTVRNMYTSNVTFRPASLWTSNILANYLNMDNGSPNDTTRVAFSSLTLGTNQIFVFTPGSFLQAVTFAYIYQQSGDDSPLRAGMKSTTHSATLGTVIPLGISFTVSPTAGVVHYNLGSFGSQTTQTYGLAVQNRAIENKLITTLASSASFVKSSTSIRNTIASNYQLTQSSVVGLSFGMTNFNGGSLSNLKFNEYVGSVTFTQRF